MSFVITEPDTILISATITDILCFSEATGVIDLTPSGGTTPYLYVWSNGETTEDISGLTAGTYSVTLTDANGCSVEYTYIVTESPLLIVTGTSSNITCYGFANGQIDITGTGGAAPYTYLWSDFDTNEDRAGLSPGV